ncbi:hypothetical protein LMG27177_06067 [Paraburkholderia fynbosensis]|uniref:Uncharacterized protein n=1 Tax=Paraburkholderia fynbosensis TaxID=1200993 RepID=A0A6J5GVB0_9BURK|nr:hypothetical protein LMG27177_06067 [Paraburkholderia fynbosensis]
MKRAYRYAASTQCAVMLPGCSRSISMEYLLKDQREASTCCPPRSSYPLVEKDLNN